MTCTETDSVLAQVLGGDIDAYEGIVRGYQQEVWKVVAAMLLNAQRTEDLVQQTFISAFQHLHRYEKGRDFGAWLKEIARNEVRQEIRRCARENRRLECYHHHLLQTYEAPPNSSLDDSLEQALQECTQKLPPAWSKLVELRYQSALNFGAIAAAVGRTVAATRQQLARVRLSLRECIENHLARL
jgi:RNA polymerase sigma-70 factor (ECF subfamily)